jgi:hypothetical protein
VADLGLVHFSAAWGPLVVAVLGSLSAEWAFWMFGRFLRA